MALRALPDFGYLIHRRRQRESVNLWRAPDYADHQRKWTLAHMLKAQRWAIVPAIAIENMTRDRRYFPGGIDALLDPVQFAVAF